MANTAIILIRTLLGLFAGCVGLFAILVGLYFLADRDAVLVGGHGLVFLVSVTLGGLTVYGAWCLLKSTLSLSNHNHSTV